MQHFPRHPLTWILIVVVLGMGAFFLSAKENDTSAATLALRTNDHVLGERDAPVKIFEWAEAECTYCKALHPMLLRVLEEHPGEAALVYRHFPLTIHQKSFDEAMALECVAEAKGDEIFFRYLARLYEVTPSNNDIDLSLLPQLAAEFGISPGDFSACVASERHQQRVLLDIEDGIGRNVDSVPHIIVQAPNGREFVFSSSPSYSVLKTVVTTALAQNP